MHLFQLLTAALTLATAVAAQCSGGIRTRKEIRNLSEGEWQAFVAGIKRIQSDGRPSTYDRLVNMHMANQNVVHGFSNFWPWHRYYLYQVETAIGAPIPYWDWSYDSQAPETSIVFRSNRFGGNGRGSNLCVQDGSFAGWQPYYPNPHCLSRNFDNGNRISSFYSTDVINGIINRNSDYSALRAAIEPNPHGSVHVGIGADMATMHSPNDPLFWVHHAFVDKIWWTWQKNRGNAYNGRNADGSAATVNDILPGFNGIRVSQTMDTRALCYTYAELEGGGTMTGQSVTPPPTPTPTTGGTKPTTTVSRTPTPTPTRRPRRHHSNWWWKRSIEEDTEGATVDLERRADGPKKSSTPVLVDSDDRKDLVNLRKPKPIPEEWCKRNNIPVEVARKGEAECDKITAGINAIDGYIPPCSLWLREDVMADLVDKVDSFVANARGKSVKAKPRAGGSTEVTIKVKEIKATVRTVCGGTVRKEVTDYKEAYFQLIGRPEVSASSVTYPFTKPGASATTKVEV